MAEKLSKLKDWIERLRVIRWLWSKMWATYLWNDRHKCYDKVIVVKGWRVALVETKFGNRRGIMPLPKWIFWDNLE